MMTPGLVVYSATKGAVKMFTQGLAREVGPRGITVDNIQPGRIDTDLNPADDEWAEPQLAATALKRYGHVDDIAPLVAFIAGPGSGYVTGASLTVDGGTNAQGFTSEWEPAALVHSSFPGLDAAISAMGRPVFELFWHAQIGRVGVGLPRRWPVTR
jgi:hypothetical protein